MISSAPIVGVELNPRNSSQTSSAPVLFSKWTHTLSCSVVDTFVASLAITLQNGKALHSLTTDCWIRPLDLDLKWQIPCILGWAVEMRLEIGAVLAQEVCEVSILSLATLVPVAASQSYNPCFTGNWMRSTINRSALVFNWTCLSYAETWLTAYSFPSLQWS